MVEKQEKIRFEAKKEDFALALNDKMNFYDGLINDFREIEKDLKEIKDMDFDKLYELFQRFNDKIKEHYSLFEDELE